MRAAFASQMKRATVNGSAGIPQGGARSMESAVDRWIGKVRSWLRFFTRGLLGRARSVVRPVAVRVRTFLVGSLEEELRQTHARIDEIGRSARRLAVACGPGEVLVRAEVGYVMCSATDLRVLALLLDSGELERGTRRLIQRLIEPGDVFIDVGAHLGLHTLAAGHAMRGSGRIYAFEPFEPTAHLLQESILINGLSDIVEIHRAAVSDHEGQQALFVGAVSGHHSLFPLSPQGGDGSSVDVPLVRLDDVLAHAPHVNLIKIDVEGSELDVLEGARSVIERNAEIALIVEFGPSHLGRAARSADEWFSSFERLGLKFREIDPETGRLHDRSVESLQEVESSNLLFARPRARVWYKAAAGR